MAGQVITYQVRVTRDGRFWVGVVDGLPGGATETRTVADLEAEVRDLIAGLTDADPDSFELDLDWTAALPRQASAAVKSVHSRRGKLRTAEREYGDAQRRAVHTLTTGGVSVRDAAALLGVSPGRISRLSGEQRDGHS